MRIADVSLFRGALGVEPSGYFWCNEDPVLAGPWHETQFAFPIAITPVSTNELRLKHEQDWLCQCFD